MSILRDRGIWADTNLTELVIKDFGGVGKEGKEIFVKMEDGRWAVGVQWDFVALRSHRICRLDGGGGGGREVALDPCLPKEFAKEAKC